MKRRCLWPRVTKKKTLSLHSSLSFLSSLSRSLPSPMAIVSRIGADSHLDRFRTGNQAERISPVSGLPKSTFKPLPAIELLDRAAESPTTIEIASSTNSCCSDSQRSRFQRLKVCLSFRLLLLLIDWSKSCGISLILTFMLGEICSVEFRNLLKHILAKTSINLCSNFQFLR